MELSTENFDGSRTEEDSDDQRDRDISELDIEHATDQGNVCLLLPFTVVRLLRASLSLMCSLLVF